MTPVQQAIVDAAREWEGTPYHHHGRIKGVGVDCAMLLAEVYETAGLTPHVDPGFYPPDWHFHQSGELYLDWLLRYADPVCLCCPQPGDVALYQFGRVGSHGGIVIQWPEIIHAYLREGCVRATGDKGFLSGRLVGFYRIRGAG